MGTEIAISFSALRAQLESEKSNLYKIDENIKKIVQTTGRFSNDRYNNSSGDYLKGGPRLGGRNLYPDFRQNDDLFGKRKQETKTVFSRLSARTADSDGEEEAKRARVPSAVSRELPTRAAVLRAQGGDERARTRNRRMFGSLLGTLQKFRQEEIVLQTKEDKRAQVERKIEEQARQLKEKELKERRTLFADRDHKKATIKALEAKMARVQEFEKWEGSQKHLANFILTRTKPHIYWIPKKMTDKATEKLTSSRKYHEKCMTKKREELQEELLRIEQRCLRRGPQAKENEPHDAHQPHDRRADSDGVRKRDKFANDADMRERDDSDGEERPVPEVEKEAPVTDESKMDTSVEQATTMETEESEKPEEPQNTDDPEKPVDGDKQEENGEKQDEHGEKQGEHGEKQEEHGEKQEEIGEKQEEHGEKQEEHGEKQEEHGEKQEEHGEKQEEHGEKQEEHGEKQQEHGEKQQEHGEKQEEHGEKQKELEGEPQKPEEVNGTADNQTQDAELMDQDQL